MHHASVLHRSTTFGSRELRLGIVEEYQRPIEVAQTADHDRQRHLQAGGKRRVTGVVRQVDPSAQLGSCSIEMTELTFGDSDRPLHACPLCRIGDTRQSATDRLVTNAGWIGFDVIAKFRHAHRLESAHERRR